MLRALHRGYVDHVLPQPQIVRRFIGRWGVPLGDALGVEIGCGASPFRDALCRCFSLHGYVATDIAPGGRTDIAADAASLPIPDGTAGLVAGFQVLQHVPDHRPVLAEAARVLRPGGTLLITYPFMYGECDVHDNRRWTMEGIARDCEQAGFEIVAHERIGGIAYMLTSLCVALINQIVPGGRKSWRSSGALPSALRVGATTLLAAPFQLLGWVALGLDRLWPKSPFYMGGILMARRAEP